MGSLKYPGHPFSYDHIPDNIERVFVPIRASDGADSISVYYHRAGHKPRTAILVVHPRGDYSRFYAAPALATNGYGVLCMNTRYLNNDIDAQHERMLLDVAAGMRYLRAQGHHDIVLLGNSGGGSLTTFYQSQAQLPAEERISTLPGGGRINLAGEDMPLATGQIQVAVHIGEGDFMAKTIDPAVVDENDPTVTDPDLDMYHPRNGRRPYPEPSTYDREWLKRYRQAQLDRCRRLDALAKSWLRARFEAGTADDPNQAYAVARRRRTSRYMVIYRTLANPFYLDPSIDPSDREIGTSFAQGLDPVVGNYGMNGLARVMTPRGWLSTWSPFSTQTRMTTNLRTITLPSLFVNATGDTEIGPSEFREIVNACPAEDKTVQEIRGNHYLRPLHQDEPDPRAELDGVLHEWLAKRFG